jgi:hypothetical protein
VEEAAHSWDWKDHHGHGIAFIPETPTSYEATIRSFRSFLLFSRNRIPIELIIVHSLYIYKPRNIDISTWPFCKCECGLELDLLGYAAIYVPGIMYFMAACYHL